MPINHQQRKLKFSSMKEYLSFLNNEIPSGTLLKKTPNEFDGCHEMHYAEYNKFAKTQPKFKKIEGLLQRDVPVDIVKRVFLDKLISKSHITGHLTPQHLLVLKHFYISNIFLPSLFMTACLFNKKIIFFYHGVADIREQFNFAFMMSKDEERYFRKELDRSFYKNIFHYYKKCHDQIK